MSGRNSGGMSDKARGALTGGLVMGLSAVAAAALIAASQGARADMVEEDPTTIASPTTVEAKSAIWSFIF